MHARARFDFLFRSFFNCKSQAAHRKIEYLEFDAHTNCSNGKVSEMAPLLDTISEQFTRFSYFWRTNKSQDVLATQTGVFRANCLDVKWMPKKNECELVEIAFFT